MTTFTAQPCPSLTLPSATATSRPALKVLRAVGLILTIAAGVAACLVLPFLCVRRVTPERAGSVA